MSLSPLACTSVNIMPSENSFKQHVETVRVALKNFQAIRQLDAPGPVKTAFDELSNATAELNRFVPFFVTHLSFQELPPLVLSTLEEFLVKNPQFEKPSSFSKLAGLSARAQDSAHTAARRGMYKFFSFFLLALTHLLS
jgi:hypothetical protein